MQIKEVRQDQDDIPVVEVQLSFAELCVLFAAVEIRDFDFPAYDIGRGERSRDGSDFEFTLAGLTEEKFGKIVRTMINSFGNMIDAIDEERNPRDRDATSALERRMI